MPWRQNRIGRMDINIEFIKSKICKTFQNPYNKPTDIIGFQSNGINLANGLVGTISEKEICFFDEVVKSDPKFHYLDFVDMLEKSQIMIFTIELPEKYYKELGALNKKCIIFVPKNYSKTISVLTNLGYAENIILM